ncbi:MAG TPA: DUF2203 domain-containing protein [Dehalococcoidia bacterium]|jgi:hypothetical protein
MPPRLFTHDEAEAMLPQIAPLLWKARELKKEHDEWQGKLIALQTQAKANGHGIDADLARSRQGLQRAAIEINGIVERVKDMGVEVKDVDLGLVDFRAEINGREAYLCWKLGEEHIAWWHDLNTGYASRQPLD